MKTLVHILLVLGIGFCSVVSQAKNSTVVFMSSVDFWDKGPLYNKGLFNNKEYELAERVRDFFSSGGFDVVIKHRANQADVWSVLHNPSVVAFFWFSHSGGTSIIDRLGFDLLPVFQEAAANLKFLSVIGCNSEKSINALRAKGYLQSQDLKIVAEEGLVYHWRETLEKHLQLAQGALLESGVESHPLVHTNAGKVIKVKRTLDSSFNFYPAIRVELFNGKVVGVFPEGRPGEVQELNFLIDLNYEGDIVLNAGNNIFTATGQLTEGEYSLGEFEITTSEKTGEWLILTDGHSKILGETSHIMRFTSNANLNLAKEKLKKVKENRLPKDYFFYRSVDSKAPIKPGKYRYLFSINRHYGYETVTNDFKSSEIELIINGKKLKYDWKSFNCNDLQMICRDSSENRFNQDFYYFKAVDEDILFYNELFSVHIFKKL